MRFAPLAHRAWPTASENCQMASSRRPLSGMSSCAGSRTGTERPASKRPNSPMAWEGLTVAMTEQDAKRFLAQFDQAREEFKTWPKWMQDAAVQRAATFPKPPASGVARLDGGHQ
jgi:hypothetical protein